MALGDYNQAFHWLKQTITHDSTTGQDVESWTDNGILWGKIEPIQGSEQTDYGTTQAQSDYIVTFNQFPSITALDRLYYVKFDEYYVINGCSRQGQIYNGYSTRCLVTTFTGLNLIGMPTF